MNDFSSFFRAKTLRTSLTIWFLLLSLLPLGWITFISYEFSKHMLLNQATENLQALSTRQAQIIENYFREKEKSIISFTTGIIVNQAIQELKKPLADFGKNASQYKQIVQRFSPILGLRAEAAGYQNILLIDKEGTVVFSLSPSELVGVNLTDSSNPNFNQSFTNLFQTTRDFLQAQVSNFIYYSPHELPSSFVSAPILDRTFTGVIMAQIDNSAIYRLLTDYSGLGKTGETFLVTDLNGHLISIAPFRHESDQSPMQMITSPAPFIQFIQEILSGQRLIRILEDYRGQESLMVGRYFIPALNWAIITKIDMAELLIPINKLKFLSFMMTITTAGIVILTASSVARAIAFPILAITRKTKLMAAGDLSQRIKVSSEDEFGRLGKSFNEMASQLDSTVRSLDSIVSKRTQQLEHQNVRLEHTVEELQQAQDRLVNQEKLASLGALTAGIAHEIKNPLNFINNFAELSLQIDDEIQAHLEKISSYIPQNEFEELNEFINTLKLNINKIYEHGKRADTIVKNMLQHSRGAPGEKIVTDVNTLLDEYVALSYHGMRALDSSFNVKLEKNYDKTIPRMPIVPQDLSRVFLNLLNNAYYSVNQKKKLFNDYSPIVRITTQNYGDLVVIKIWDNGQGISDDILPKLFTPFFTTKPTGEGTGLGLSLSYNIIVQGHNGMLMVNSQPGEFAEFVIHLPIKMKYR